jgi:hypothetical protein
MHSPGKVEMAQRRAGQFPAPGRTCPVTVAGPRRTRTGFLAPARDLDLSGHSRTFPGDDVKLCDRPLAGAREPAAPA